MKCKICNRKLDSRGKARRHYETDHPKRPPKCKNCGKQLPANQPFAHFYGCTG